MNKKTILLIGSEGNVGLGIKKAFENAGFSIVSIDPKINKAFEQYSDDELREIVYGLKDIIYSADLGNRDKYDEDKELWRQNNERFANFIQRISKISSSVQIWYVGGSWTKRKPDSEWIVNDDSSNKNENEANSYEKAKIHAEENARELSRFVKIRFLDWASIVPNLSPNFTITKMIREALVDGKISYSSGFFGRPILDSVQAGEALVVLLGNDTKDKFKVILIPGTLVKFETFAEVVRDVIIKETGKKVELVRMENTPDFLKSTTESVSLAKLGFIPDKVRAIDALRTNAIEVYRML
jgi:nucleoside-diphosphate-sugar epimerase